MLIYPKSWNFQQHHPTCIDHNSWTVGFMHFGKVSKFYITFILCLSPDSAPYSVTRVLWDHRQSKLEFVFKVLPLVYCVPTIITSSMFIGFECMSMTKKLRKLATSLLLRVFWDSTWTRLKTLKFLDCSNLICPKIQQPNQLQKVVTPKLLIVSRCANNCWKGEKLFYMFSAELQVRFWLKGHQSLKFVNAVQLGQIRCLLHFILKLSPLPLLKSGSLLRIDFWTNSKSFAW
jgi:hypothetical protein